MIIDTSKTKPPFKLFVRLAGGDLKEQIAHACGECLIVQPTEREALECCGVQRCDCGVEISEYCYTACGPCRATSEAKRDAERLAKAKRVPESEASMLYCDCCEGFFADSGELVGTHEDDGRAVPSFAQACQPRAFGLDADRILEAELDGGEWAEGTTFEPEAVAELQALIDGWCAKHPLINHFPDYGAVVDLAEAKAEMAKESDDAP